MQLQRVNPAMHNNQKELVSALPAVPSGGSMVFRKVECVAARWIRNAVGAGCRAVEAYGGNKHAY